MNQACGDAVLVVVKHHLDDRRLLLPVLATAVVIAVGAVLIVVLSKDASSESPASSASSPASTKPAGGSVKVDIADFKFVPPMVTVKAGGKVTWTNSDTAPHTATAADMFDTGTLNKGDSKTLTLPKRGSYSYICSFHVFMKGTVVVT